MLDDIITKFVGFKNAKITNISTFNDFCEINVEMPKEEQCCPNCKNMTSFVHDYRIQYIKDLDSFGKRISIKYRKRRYVCPVCKKRFYERNSIVGLRQRNTQRLFVSVIVSFKDKVSVKDIAKRHHISSTTALRYMESISFPTPSLPRVLSIDEFKGNVSKRDKYQVILTDAENKRIIDILPTRYENDLVAYFNKCKGKENVKFVVIDMNGHFDRVARKCFPKAIIIVDKFHAMRQVLWAMERVRKVEQDSLPDKYRKYFKHSKRYLYKSINQLSSEEKDRVSLMFEIRPRLKDAYYLKDKLLQVFQSPNSIVAAKRLGLWLSFAQSRDFPEFRDCINCYRNWADEILHSLDYCYTNGYTEGCNNKSKVIKRIAFNMRNFSHFKTRILFAQENVLKC